MLPPLPSVDSVLVSSSAEESSCVEEKRYLFVSLRSKTNSNTGQALADPAWTVGGGGGGGGGGRDCLYILAFLDGPAMLSAIDETHTRARN